MHLPAQASQGDIGAQQVLRCDAPHRQHDLGFQQGDLLFQVGQAFRGFARRRIAIAGRPAFEDIGDVNLLARQTDRTQHGIQELTGPAHKGLTLAILIGARRFADNEPFRPLVAHAEHSLSARAAQRAAGASGHPRSKLRPVGTRLSGRGKLAGNTGVPRSGRISRRPARRRCLGQGLHAGGRIDFSGRGVGHRGLAAHNPGLKPQGGEVLSAQRRIHARGAPRARRRNLR